MNSTLRLKGKRSIKEVQLLPIEQLPKISESKKSILDVRCTDDRGFQYIVEMQSWRFPNFMKRTQFYVASTYSGQLDKGEDYISLRPVILLAVADYEIFPKKSHYISYHATLDRDTQEHDLQDMSYAFIELPKFSKKEDELTTEEDHWIYMFKNASQLKDIPNKLAFPEIIEAYKTLEQYKWTPEEKAEYDRTRIAMMDDFDAIRGATEEGIAQGIAQEKGRVVIKLLKNQIDDQTILEVVGITRDQLEAFKEKLTKTVH